MHEFAPGFWGIACNNDAIVVRSRICERCNSANAVARVSEFNSRCEVESGARVTIVVSIGRSRLFFGSRCSSAAGAGPILDHYHR